MTSQAQKGFTLIEILVAVLVLSIGVLGLVGMESLALQNNQEAYHRSQATLFAYELADKIRANPGADYSISIPGTAPTTRCIAYQLASASTCSGANLVKEDLYAWNTKIQQALPLGSGSLVVANGLYTISITWDQDRNGGPDTGFEMSFRP